MKSFKIFLKEARKNPEVNIKIPVYKQLEPYKNRKDVYISMRDINKLGINPNSRFNTPNSIYAYPLWLVWDLIDSTKSLSKLPFQGEMPYVYVFTPKFTPIMLGELTRSWVIDFLSKVINKPNYKLFFSGDAINISPIKINIDILNNLIKRILNTPKFKLVNDITNYLEPPEIYEFKKFIQNENKFKDEKDFFNLETDESIKKTIKTIELYKQHLIKNLEEKTKLNFKMNLDAKEIYEYIKKTAHVKSPGGIFWDIGYRIARENPNKWNAFFREFGIYGVVDSKGEGIIHEHEPVQAAFFDKTKIKTIKVIDNKEYTIKNK